jgi:copper transporter 1
MLFTWSTENLCIVFRSWHVRNTFTLLLSLVLIIVLCAGYEAVRELSRRYETSLSKRSEGPAPPSKSDSAALYSSFLSAETVYKALWLL